MASANTTDTPAVDDQILKGKLAWNNNNNNYNYPPVNKRWRYQKHVIISQACRPMKVYRVSIGPGHLSSC